MNTCCPGFMPHHVKPNRCRRCFKDIHDHQSSSEVTTSFTLPLPRRRRESVALAEAAPKAVESPAEQSASFTITEPTASGGVRTRQRSSSTSSWFQEKKVNEENKEKIDALFRNADDSRASYKTVGVEDDTDDKVDAVAIIRLPEARSRSRRTQDDSKPPELPPKTLDNKFDFVKRTTEPKKDSDAKPKFGSSSESLNRSSSFRSTPATTTTAETSVGRSSSFRSTPATTPDAETSVGRSSSIRSTPATTTTAETSVGRSSSFKSTPATTTTAETSVGRSSSFRSRFEPKSTDEPPSKVELKPVEKKSLESKFNEKKPPESKFGEGKLRDTKLSEIRARASKFETGGSKIDSVASKFEKPALDSKPKDTAPTKLSTESSKSKLTESKPTDLSKTDPPKVTDVKPKEAPKPVLARFSNLRSTTEPAKSVPAAPVKPTPAPAKKPPSSSSSEEEETESESSEEPPPPPPKPKPVTTPKEPDKKIGVLPITKVQPKSEPTKTETQPLPTKFQKDQENKIKELQDTLEHLRSQLKTKEDAVSRLEREKADFQKKQQAILDKDKEALEKTAQELSKMRNKLMEMQSSQDEVKSENRKLKQELKDKGQELKEQKQELKDKVQELKDQKQELNKAKQELTKKQQESIPEKSSKANVDTLKIKLAQSEALCEELMEENEEIKKEVRDLEQELEELHDNFREDQASEFRGLKKELETATKNCRVLQFKLRKAEKKCELMELDRHSLEDKVREYQAAVRQDVDRSRFKDLEKELSLARNLTTSLGKEVKELKEALLRAEAENEGLRQGKRSVTPTSQSRLSPVVKELAGGKDYEALSHELSDTMERENDLREQFRFVEEEVKQARRKMAALEQENETLVLQIKKLTAIVQRTKPGLKDEEADEEVSAETLKIQMELMEQEMGVVRRKLDEAEKENEGLQAEVKYLQEKVINQPLIELPELPKDAGSPGVYWENKVRLQEFEIRETRKKMIEKDREIERLNAEVAILRKKASKMMVRSRSLDGDLQVDLKRQLQLVEQEASILRQKVNSLENENEKLNTENKRMTLRLTKKPPPSSLDLLQMDNMELKQKLEEQQRKLEAMKEELEKADSPSSVLIQDYKPRRESLTSLLSESESDLIASLKRRLRSRDEEQQQLQARCMQLEVENGRLARDHRKLKEALSSKKRPMKAVRENASRVELRELVSELQDEISELQVTLRSREVLQEGLEEELEKVKKDLKDALKDLKHKEEVLQLELDKGKHEKDTLKKEVDAQKKRASEAEVQLTQLSRGGNGEEQRRLQELTAEREDADRRARAAEEALEKKTQRLRDTQEKLNTAAALREDMARSNRLLQSQKADLEKEAEEHRSLLAKAEAKAAELRSQLDKTDRDLTSLRKECNQIRNELEDERSRLKQSSRQSEVSLSWNREREDLRRNINELKNRIEQLQRNLTENDKNFIEKESRLRDEFKRKKENAVREAREKGEAALELAKEEEKILRNKIQEITDKLEKAEKSVREAAEKARKAASEQRREREEWQRERDALEAGAQAEVRGRERAEREAEQQLKQRDEELLLAKERVVAMEREQRRLQMQLDETEELRCKVRILEKEADAAKEDYEHLTAKYDQLEEEFVKTKSKLVLEKEQAEAGLIKLRKEYNELNFECSSLKESYNSRQDNWIKDKLDLQERVKELNRRLDRLKSVEQDRRGLQDLVEEKEKLIESYKKEEKYLKEERDRLRKRVEDLGKAYETSKERSLASSDASSTAGDAGLRREYEGRMSIMSSEISSMQAQIATLVEERDRLRTQVSSVERNAEELRTGSLKRERTRHREEADAARRKVQELRYQLEDVREQLDDSLLENKNLKLQIDTDKNGFDIQIAELKSKINQLEEQKLLESTRGQTRSIAKTRLELTWEKERAELQGLLNEGQRQLTELKERLQLAEGEKDKEKAAVRRQLLDMRSAAEKERQESRRKMSELHSSLLELRESHAKLRGLYDRMKKEREILLKEREEWRQRLQVAMQLHTKISEIVKYVEKVSSDVSASEGKASLSLSSDFKEAVKKVKESISELQKSAETLKEDERLKRTTSFRRAVSAQDVSGDRGDPMDRWNNPQRVTNYPVAPPSMILRPPPRQKALQRKSLSLDHAMAGTSHEQRIKIWESEGESMASSPAGSLLSLGGGYGYETDSSMPDSEYRYGGITQNRRRYMVQTPSGMTTDSEAPYSSREGSVDPGGSSESVPLASQHQRKTFKDKLKMLRRTKSIDVTTGQKPGSSDKNKEEKEQSLRSKISKVLKKPLGRSLSMEAKKPGPALPPKGVVPDVVPSRPTAEKPLSASRGELSSRKAPSSSQDKRTKPPSKPGFETPV